MNVAVSGERAIYVGMAGNLMWCFTVLMALALVVSLCLLVNTRKKLILYALFLIWTLLPPLWFSFEYFILFKNGFMNEGNDQLFEHLKYGQDLSSKVWAAMVAVITARITTFVGISALVGDIKKVPDSGSAK